MKWITVKGDGLVKFFKEKTIDTFSVSKNDDGKFEVRVMPEKGPEDCTEFEEEPEVEVVSASGVLNTVFILTNTEEVEE